MLLADDNVQKICKILHLVGQGQGQLKCFLVIFNASPPKPLDEATLHFAGVKYA